MRYQVVKRTATEYPVDAVCRVVRVSRSGFYAWQQRMVSGELPASVELTAKVEAIFWRHSRRYGSRRVEAEPKAEGTAVGRRLVRRVMRERNLRAIQPKSYVPRTTDSRHGKRASPNLLDGALLPHEPNRVLVGDITHLPLLGGVVGVPCNMARLVLAHDCWMGSSRDDDRRVDYHGDQESHRVPPTGEWVLCIVIAAGSMWAASFAACLQATTCARA